MPLFSGQAVASSTPQQLDPTGTAGSCSAFVIKASTYNTSAGVFVGGTSVSSSTGFRLDPGDQIAYERISQNGQPAYEQRPSDFWVVGTAPDVVTWLALG